jgi:hypothetical protein
LYPTHFLIGLVTFVIFIIILIGKKIFNIRVKNIPKNLDYIALAAVLLSLAIFVGTPYSQQSLLDYHVKFPNDTSISVDVLNSGAKEAKNVLISLNSKNIKFSNFTTLPYLPIKSVNANKMIQSGNANFTLESLPAGSFTTVYAKVNASQNKENLTVYVRAEDAVAYFNLAFILSYYILLSAVYIITAYLFWFPPQKIKIPTGVIFAIGITVIFLIQLFLPWFHDCGFTYTGCY